MRPFRVTLTRPRQKAQGWMRPQAHALGEDASEGGLAEHEAFAGEHDAQPALAHEGEPGPHRPDAAFVAAGPPGALGMARAAASVALSLAATLAPDREVYASAEGRRSFELCLESHDIQTESCLNKEPDCHTFMYFR